MTKFLDGPAIGQTLMLKRAPIFLRVTVATLAESGRERVDALDQLEDNALPDETLHCYVMSKYLGSCHIKRSGGGGFYQMAEYKLRDPQPTDADMRSNEAWATWCESQPDKEALLKKLQPK